MASPSARDSNGIGASFWFAIGRHHNDAPGILEIRLRLTLHTMLRRVSLGPVRLAETPNVPCRRIPDLAVIPPQTFKESLIYDSGHDPIISNTEGR